MTDEATGQGTKDDPWKLQTASQTSSYEMYRDGSKDPPVLICQVGKTQLQYDLRAIDDLHAMLLAHGDWMPIGGTDEQKWPRRARSAPTTKFEMLYAAAPPGVANPFTWTR